MATKTLLIFPFDLMAHYLRCIQLASHYKGYTILFARSVTYNKYVTEAGYGLFEAEGFDPETVMTCSRKFDFSWLNKKDIERVYLSQMEAIQYYRPDIVIGDTSPTLKMAAEKIGVKYIALMNGYMTKYYAETRVLSRTHPGYPYLTKLPPRVAKNLTSIAEKFAFIAVHQPFRQLRKKYKLKRLISYLDEMEGDENLICDKAELFPQKKMPKTYKVVGPLYYLVKTDNKILQGTLDNNKQTICVCMGSSGNWDELAFLSNTIYSKFNIVTGGDHHNRVNGAHVVHKHFLNLDEIVPKSAVLICHGGNGTIYKGIEHNVFMLCLTSHFEQEWNVQMLERLGLGMSINENPEKIINQYLQMLH